MTQLDGGIVLPKKLSIGIAALIVGQVFYFGYSYATAQGRLERLERDAIRDTATIVDMRDRVVRIETQTGFIREAVDRLSKR